MGASGSVCYESYVFERYQPYGDPVMEKLLERIEQKTGIPILQDHHDFEDLE
jgi:N-formylglutamate amidohydrolase